MASYCSMQFTCRGRSTVGTMLSGTTYLFQWNIFSISPVLDMCNSSCHDQVRREPLPVEHNDQEDDTSSDPSNQSSAASPSSAADWAQAARRGQRLTDLTAKGASQSPHTSQAQAGSAGRGNTGASVCSKHPQIMNGSVRCWIAVGSTCTDVCEKRAAERCVQQ